MQKTIKAFGVLDQFENTVTGDTAVVGELSNKSKTFSTNQDVLTDDDKDAGRGVVFSARDENGVHLDVIADYRDFVLDAIERVATFNAATSAEDQFLAEYPSPAFTNVAVGPSVLAGGRHIPTFVQFDTVVGPDTYTIKIWFSDSAFANEFDEWEIRVIPPLPIPNDMYTTHASMVSRLDTVSNQDQLGRVTTVAGQDPQTELVPFTLRWFDRTDTSLFVDTEWIILAYGPLASNHSNIITGIREYLVANSGHTLEEWVEHFPDLVSVNRFTIVPQWNNPAVDTDAAVPSFYSPNIKPDTVIAQARAILPTVIPAELDQYVCTTAIFFKSLGIVAIGNQGNPDGRKGFDEAFPDFAILEVNDANLGRLAEDTRQTIIAIEQLATLAETDDGSQPLPPYASRENIGAVSTLTKVVGSILIRVVTRASYRNLFPPATP